MTWTVKKGETVKPITLDISDNKYTPFSLHVNRREYQLQVSAELQLEALEKKNPSFAVATPSSTNLESSAQ